MEKNKQFEEWLLRSRYNTESVFEPFCTSVKEIKSKKGKNEYEYSYDCRDFYKFPFSMQWGIYLEFFDSIGQQIEITHYRKQYLAELMFDNWAEYFDSRQEAQTEAIKKAFEILNSK